MTYPRPRSILAERIITEILEPHLLGSAKNGMVPPQAFEDQLNALAGCVGCTLAATNFKMDALVFFQEALAGVLLELMKSVLEHAPGEAPSVEPDESNSGGNLH